MDQVKESPIGKLRMALYGLVNLPTSIVGLPISLYIPAFYSQNLGLSLAAVGALIALSRISDVGLSLQFRKFFASLTILTCS